MILWRQRAHAHEFFGTDLDDLNAQVVMEMRNDFVGHVVGTLCHRLEFQIRQSAAARQTDRA